MITLYATFPTSGVSFNGQNYPVKNGSVTVPEEAAATFIETFGFTAVPPDSPPARLSLRPSKGTEKESLAFANPDSAGTEKTDGN